MRRVNKFRGTSIQTNECYTGEPLYKQLRIATKTKNPIKMDAPIIYTDKKEGVKPQYDIRSDKWEIAQNAMDYVNATAIAKGQQYTDVSTEATEAKEATEATEGNDSGEAA